MKSVRQLEMVQAQQVQHGGLQVVDVDAVGLFGRIEAQLVGLADRLAGLDAAAGQPHGVGFDVVVAADRAAHLAHRRAAEFSAPDHQRLVEQPALLEVVEQSRTRLVDLTAGLLESFLQVLAAAVMIPFGVKQRNESRAPFDQPPGQQTIVGERRPAGLRAVGLQRRGRFVAQIDQFRRAGLHPLGHLVAGDPRIDLRVAGHGQSLAVQLHYRIDRPMLSLASDARRAVEIQNRIALAAQRHALVDARQEPVRPKIRPAPRPARTRLQHHEAGQILALAAQAVGNPRADRRPTESRRAGLGQQLGRPVIEDVSLHRPHDGDVVGHAAQVRQQLRDFRARLAVSLELANRAQTFGVFLEESEPLALQVRLRNRLAGKLF